MTLISTQSLVRRRPSHVAWFSESLQLTFILVTYLYFLLPPKLLLVMGWEYLGGGAEFEKIHVATYLVLFVFSLMLIVDTRFRDAALSLCCTDLTLIAFMISAATAAFYAIIAKQVSIAPFIDTFMAAVVTTIGCICLSGRYLRAFRYLLDAYFITSIAIVFFEYYTNSSIIFPSNYISYQGSYRTSALFGGPLDAACLFGLYSLVLLISTRISFSLRCMMRLLLSFAAFTAILTTGGRTSLVASIVIGAGFLCVSLIIQIRRGYINKAGLVYCTVAIPFVIIGFFTFLWLGLFDTVAARFQNDIGSAFSRELALDMLFNMSTIDLWFGLSTSDVLNLIAIQKELGLIAIEISWINFILVCGLAFTIPLFFGYLLFLFRFLPKYCGLPVFIPSLFLLVNVSSSNGIWSKTTILSTSLALIISFLRRVDLSKVDPHSEVAERKRRRAVAWRRSGHGIPVRGT